MNEDELQPESLESDANQRIVKELFATAEFSFQVEDWLRSPVGRYLSARAERERAEHARGLEAVAPEDAPAIRELQTRIRICDSWQQWLADAITEGKTAHQQLVNMGQ